MVQNSSWPFWRYDLQLQETWFGIVAKGRSTSYQIQRFTFFYILHCQLLRSIKTWKKTDLVCLLFFLLRLLIGTNFMTNLFRNSGNSQGFTHFFFQMYQLNIDFGISVFIVSWHISAVLAICFVFILFYRLILYLIPFVKWELTSSTFTKQTKTEHNRKPCFETLCFCIWEWMFFGHFYAFLQHFYYYAHLRWILLFSKICPYFHIIFWQQPRSQPSPVISHFFLVSEQHWSLVSITLKRPEGEEGGPSAEPSRELFSH